VLLADAVTFTHGQPARDRERGPLAEMRCGWNKQQTGRKQWDERNHQLACCLQGAGASAGGGQADSQPQLGSGCPDAKAGTAPARRQHRPGALQCDRSRPALSDVRCAVGALYLMCSVCRGECASTTKNKISLRRPLFFNKIVF
jgi:hypothetical protein